MKFIRFACTAALLLGVAQSSAAQSVEATGTTGSTISTPGLVATIDVTRLPIDLKRIEQRFRQSQIREERDGLNLRYFVDVFAKAPNLVLLTKEDNLVYGPVPKTAPTHRDMLDMMTPREFRHIGGVNILDPNPSKKK